MSEDLRTDGVMEECELVQTLAVYTNATCEALYLEASRFLLLLHRKEGVSTGEEQRTALPVLGDLPGAFAAQGIDLTRLEGFDAYDLLRIILHCQGHIPGDTGEALQELQRRRPYQATPSPAGRGTAFIQPAEVKQLYEDLCKFLHHVIEALHLS